jgi:hypothetical protein
MYLEPIYEIAPIVICRSPVLRQIVHGALEPTKICATVDQEIVGTSGHAKPVARDPGERLEGRAGGAAIWTHFSSRTTEYRAEAAVPIVGGGGRRWLRAVLATGNRVAQHWEHASLVRLIHWVSAAGQARAS